MNWDDRLTGDQVEKSLQGLARAMRERWLLFDVLPFDLDQVIQEEVRTAANGLKRFELELAVQRVITHGSDGHAHAGNFAEALLHSSGKCRLSFLIVPLGGRYVATKSRWRERNQLWKAEHPYISAIDGVPIDRWVSQAERYISQTNSTSRRSHAAQLVSYLGHFRKELGLPASERIRITLQATSGAETTVDMPFPDEPVSPFAQLAYATYRLAEKNRDVSDSRVLDDNIGYLHLPSAGARTMEAISQGMPKMRRTDGLIIDLRSNPGGSFEFAMLLAQWLASPENERAFGGFSWGPSPSADNCPSYVIDEPGLSDAGRELLRKARAQFKPKWQPADHLNAKLEYYLLTSWKTEPAIAPYNRPELSSLFTQLDLYPYHQKVVVLVDRYTNSAAEVGAALLRSFPQVVVMGEPTRGAVGSHNVAHREAQPLRIPHAQEPHLVTKTVFLDFQGNMIEGRGIWPDIPHEIDLPTIAGPGDTMLHRAREYLKAGRK